MWGTKAPFSHVAIKMMDGDTDQTVYYQASGLMVNCVGEDEFLAAETIVCKKDVIVSDKVFKAGKSFAINQLGKPYNMMAILGFAWQILLSRVGIKINNPFKADGNQYVCSQFAAAFIDASENINLDVTDMTPKTLFDSLKDLPAIWN